MDMDGIKLLGSLLFSVAITCALISALDENFRIKCLGIVGIKPFFGEAATAAEVFRLDLNSCTAREVQERYDLLLQMVDTRSRFPIADGKRLHAAYKTAMMALIQRDAFEGLNSRRAAPQPPREPEHTFNSHYYRTYYGGSQNSRARTNGAAGHQSSQQSKQQSSQQSQQQGGRQNAQPQRTPKGIPWRVVLGVSASEKDASTIKTAYRKRAQRAHPDKGGSNDAMAQVNQAYDAAKAELQF